jgi:hypothetical protein
MIAIFNPGYNYCGLFTTKTEAARALKINSRTIERAINKKRPTKSGFYCFEQPVTKTKTMKRGNKFA